MKTYDHVVQAVYFRPWAILEPYHEIIRAAVRRHVEGVALSSVELQDRLAAGRQRATAPSIARVAVIPVHGVIVPRASIFSAMSGGTSIEELSRTFRSALSDEEVDAIVFDMDSPGGIVDGVPEFAEEIRASRGRKPIAAVSNTMMASAAYWLGSQADEITVTPSGEAGSIGVFSAHEDWSAWWEAEGIKTTLISAGKFKTEGNEFEPLGDEARAFFQSKVDDYYGMFVRDVAAGRKASTSAVRAGYGQGRMLTAKDAVAADIADRVATLEDTIVRVGRQGALQRREREAVLDGGHRIAVLADTMQMRALVDERIAEAFALENEGQPEPTETPEEEPAEETATGPTAEFYALRRRTRR
jgi:signal peptide peptidase SppA